MGQRLIDCLLVAAIIIMLIAVTVKVGVQRVNWNNNYHDCTEHDDYVNVMVAHNK